jgi:hypothetical protein
MPTTISAIDLQVDGRQARQTKPLMRKLHFPHEFAVSGFGFLQTKDFVRDLKIAFAQEQRTGI